MAVKNIRTRQELLHHFDERMNATYSSLSDNQELDSDTSLVKTYLIEAHLSENATTQELDKMFAKLTETQKATNNCLNILPSDDPKLYVFSADVDGELITLYADVSNPRFWTLHSSGRSTSLDWLIDRTIKQHFFLDHAWFWPSLLNRLSNKGAFKGLSLDYDRRAIPDVDFEASQSVEYLKMQLWGTAAGDVFRVLSKSFPSHTTLSKVKIKYWLSAKDDGVFTIDDFKFDGKITARGTSFVSHISLVSDTYNEYIQTIRKIENEYSMNWTGDNGMATVSGKALAIRFPTSIKHLDQFCEYLFSSSLPFRLWGVPVMVHENFYRVSGIDLHANCRLDFEITPEFMRLYLPSGSCGNTIARLFTNLKHYYDSQIEAVGEDDERIF
jgi:hypothetical protein